MDSSPSAQNDNTLCGNAYRPSDCTSERQAVADYGTDSALCPRHCRVLRVEGAKSSQKIIAFYVCFI
jgi:hypothetical protein